MKDKIDSEIKLLQAERKDLLTELEKEYQNRCSSFMPQSEDEKNELALKMAMQQLNKDLDSSTKIALVNQIFGAAGYLKEIEREALFLDIKKSSGLSLPLLRKTWEGLKRSSELEEQPKPPAALDPRFKDPKLFLHILEELKKSHVGDEIPLLAGFVVAASSYLPRPKDHVSAALKGDSSSGKDNIIRSVLSLFPKEDSLFLTRITRSEMEDQIGAVRILALSEMNIGRDGANAEILEAFKQAVEDGLRVMKKDLVTGESLYLVSEQKTGLFATTETYSDSELETRYLVIPLSSTISQNKAVCADSAEKYADPAALFAAISPAESWICKSLRALDANLMPFVKYAPALLELIDGHNLFEFDKARVRRDFKRLLSLTMAIAWLHQHQRQRIEYGGQTCIQAEPSDFINALFLFKDFLNLSYSGMDPRLQQLLDLVKLNEGKFEALLPLDEVGRGWVPRHEVVKQSGKALNTVKRYLRELESEELIETFDSYPLKFVRRGVSNRVSTLVNGCQLTGIDRHLTGYNTYKYPTYLLTPEDISKLTLDEKDHE